MYAIHMYTCKKTKETVLRKWPLHCTHSVVSRAELSLAVTAVTDMQLVGAAVPFGSSQFRDEKFLLLGTE